MGLCDVLGLDQSQAASTETPIEDSLHIERLQDGFEPQSYSLGYSDSRYHLTVIWEMQNYPRHAI